MEPSRRALSRGEALHAQIARHIANDISAGRLVNGATLPSTKALASEWGVSPFTISEAMKLLAGEGLVVNEARSRRTVRAPRQGRSDLLRDRRPQVILIGGYPGSGKSELARTLAREVGWTVIDKDTVTRPLVEQLLEVLGRSPHDRESEVYLNQVRPREYEAVAAVVTENLQCGNSVIADAPFLREFTDPAWLCRTIDAHAAFNADTTVVWVACDAQTMHSYLRRRGAARDATKLADWTAHLEGLDLNFRPPIAHVVVENSASSEPLQSQARRIIDKVAA
ncbi:AAA family ATPase [Pseudonocardia sp. ICBG1142]|uniref:AAA family ATPase n=1 Tax=Pseudonocardia sp. ICBG1142 TaxID=2846760 RepID=UPI001CF6EE6C|nr:AAA family ATPase [Pseudonocardia sp. ICBG1142]